MPTKGNNCLLHSLTYDGAPRGSDQSAASMRALREAIAATAVAYRDYDLNGKTLEGWVSATADMDLESWAADFVANDTMCDQIVLRISFGRCSAASRSGCGNRPAPAATRTTASFALARPRARRRATSSTGRPSCTTTRCR